MSTTFLGSQDVIEIGRDSLDLLKQEAESAPLRRSRYCLHRDTNDPVQEMIIAFCKDSYVPPHKHSGKSESFHIVEGELLVFFFDDHGEVTEKIEMGPIESGKTFVYRLNSTSWHTVVPLSDYVVIHETTTGPFVKSSENLAEWAPHEDNEEEVEKFIEELKKT